MRYIVSPASVEYIFSPLPRLPYATIDAVYPRDLYIFHVRARSTYIHTYIPLLRRHSTPLLRIKRNEIPCLQLALPRHDIYTDFDPSLSIHRCFNFSKLFFFFPLKFSFLFTRVETRVDPLDRLRLAVLRTAKR